jgi:hypothetical protein
MSAVVQIYYDRVGVQNATITSAASQITWAGGFRVASVQLSCATTWQYSNASAGNYFDVPANAIVELTLLDAFSKLWFKHASSATLLAAAFGYGTI